MLGRADRAQSGDDGRRAQLRRHFRLTPDHWPMAAPTRQMDAGDAAGAVWLRADPSYVRPDINGARLLAIGAALGTDGEERTAFLPAPGPLFGAARRRPEGRRGGEGGGRAGSMWWGQD